MDSDLKAAHDEAVAGVGDERLRALLRDHWAWTLARNPQWATHLGVHAYDDQIADNSPEALATEKEKRRVFLDEARALDPGVLDPDDSVTLQLFVEELKAAIASEVCAFEEWSFSPRSNPVTTWNYLPVLHRVESYRDADNLLSRYRAIPGSIDNEVALFRIGAAKGLFANAESTRRTIEMVRRQLEQPLDEWPLLKPTHVEAPDASPQQLARFRSHIEDQVANAIRPALARYVDFLEAKIMPHARPDDRSGVCFHPDGDACYGARVRAYTTLPISTEEVHRRGREEVAGINEEMRALGERLFGTHDLAAILERLRGDPELYFRTSKEVEAAAENALAAAKAKMSAFFDILPRADCVVQVVPDYEAPYTTIAYYRGPKPDGSKPGEYFVNTYEPETRPRFEAKVLAYHESIPGHHLQIAIAQELPALPAFRKHGGMTVYVEGWALYIERLAEEMGLYEDDLDRMGMLSFDAWRASRLVVDSGIHAKGWSRDRARQYMADQTALALNNIDNEVDRYITWPGQALAYKIGQLEMWDLRREAEAALGPAFDLPSFHGMILAGGAVSLGVLRERAAAWIAECGLEADRANT